MGGGGRMSPKDKSSEQAPVRRAPSEKPPFTLADVKKAIPPHCFRRSLLRSSSYVVRDLAAVAALFYLAVCHFPHLPALVSFLAWPLYWVVQGCVLMGVWVLAHECGHNAFSDYPVLDDAVGMVLHSALLVPYFSWKYSHRRHHATAGTLDRDEVFLPRRKGGVPWFSRLLASTPPGRVLSILISLTFGWPSYLAFNITGREYGRFASHFDPYSPIYTRSQRWQIVLSDAGFLLVGYLLFRLACRYSLGWVLRVYGAPLLVVNALLVLIVYLHHVHLALPHYDSAEWEWLRGTLSTVDRDYGVLNVVLHHITDTHIVHHLFSTLPHYHAVEATAAIKPVLGEYYQFDRTPIAKALWRETRDCLYVEPDEVANGSSSGIFWYRSSP
ncbi:hypothetical protein Taro_054846 [Colocasia esculenta]|uniref:Uncharacterized protein n=1 Tax=Colocasia esculenta TaxID=4460 RepID=A0A843XRP6_COLES|nr:hypothetical protein [Colocasia esculenta]